MKLGTRFKTAAETRLFTFDWADHLEAGQLITGHTITVPAGVTLVSSSVAAAGTAVSFLLSGGTLGQRYEIKCAVNINASSESLERTGIVEIK